MAKNRFVQPHWSGLRDVGIPASDFRYYEKIPGLVADLVAIQQGPSEIQYRADLCGVAMESFKRVDETRRTARMVDMFRRLDEALGGLNRRLLAEHERRRNEASASAVKAAVRPSAAEPAVRPVSGGRRGRPSKGDGCLVSRAVRLDADQVRRLDAVAEECGVSVSAIIRNALNDYLGRYGRGSHASG